jgi:ribonuclease D
VTASEICLAKGDIDSDTLRSLSESGLRGSLGVDIETTGLSPLDDRVEVISLAVPGTVAVVALDNGVPARVAQLLSNRSIMKVFHHASFDLGFISQRWHLDVAPVFCTKVAARLAEVGRNPHLKDLVADLLGGTLDKGEQRSNWSQRPLTEAQLRYAANDVKYLDSLRQDLERRIDQVGRRALFEACMRFLSTRTELDLLGLGDVFAYEIPEREVVPVA